MKFKVFTEQVNADSYIVEAKSRDEAVEKANKLWQKDYKTAWIRHVEEIVGVTLDES